MKVALLDMDGVIAHFIRGWLNLRGFAEHEDHYYAGREGTWWFNELVGVSVEDFWAGIDEEFWATLPWTPDGRQILDAVEQTFGRENVVIVTSPCSNRGCHDGKLRWMREHLPKHYSSSKGHIFGSAKHLLANPDHVLIDDHDDNVDKYHTYKDMRAPYVHVPRISNRRHAERGRAASIVAEELRA